MKIDIVYGGYYNGTIVEAEVEDCTFDYDTLKNLSPYDYAVERYKFEKQMAKIAIDAVYKEKGVKIKECDITGIYDSETEECICF